VLDALRRKDFTEAARRLNAWHPIAPLDRAWRLALSGETALAQKELVPASIALCQAFTQATIQSADANEPDVATARRLAARALLDLGRVYRRQDRFDDASRTHRAAAEAIEQFGSAEESWQIQRELGLDASVAQEFESAAHHLQLALTTVAQCVESPKLKRAVCLTNLARVALAQSRWEEAVENARGAWIAWQAVDASTPTVPIAEILVGTALLRHGEALIEPDPQSAHELLTAATQSLTSAQQALRAFGPEHAPDVELCDQQIDFAQRLRASLELGSLKQ